MKTNKKYIIALILVFTITGAGIITFIVFQPSKKSFESKIQDLMIKYDVPSLAAGIAINESLIWANGFGDQSDLDTVYMIGSITKTFTATSLLQLNESNLINLDDDINEYLPFDVRHPSFPSTPITIHMLLTHTAGLTRDFDISYYFDKEMIQWINSIFGTSYTYWDPKPSLEEFLNGSLNPSGPYYDSDYWVLEPGTEFFYSNAGFELLGYLVEEVTNQSIVEYVQEDILDPLNMTNSGYNYIDFTGMNAIPYERLNESNLPIPIYNLSLNGAGSLRSTVPDLAKYLIAHMNQGKYNEFQLLTPEKIELMHKKHVLIPGSEPAGYGLGWFVVDGIQGHDGATPGFLSSMYMEETEQGAYGIIVMFNRGSSLILDIELLTEFYPAILQLLLKRAEASL
ncbi:MAG: serine hydrolase domain-containing protein [Candidatus Hodarchaeota archaeon]